MNEENKKITAEHFSVDIPMDFVAAPTDDPWENSKDPKILQDIANRIAHMECPGTIVVTPVVAHSLASKLQVLLFRVGFIKIHLDDLSVDAIRSELSRLEEEIAEIPAAYKVKEDGNPPHTS